MYKFVHPILMGFASWGLVMFVSVSAGSEVVEEKSISTLIADAERGDVESQWLLGYLYKEGVKVEEDVEKSLRWTKLAAEAGHPRAQYNMAAFYMEGETVGKDITESLRWLRLSAHNGLAEAMDLSLIHI